MRPLLLGRRGALSRMTSPVGPGGKHVSSLHYNDYLFSTMQYGLGDYFLCGEWATGYAVADLSIPVYSYASGLTAKDSFFTGLTATEALSGGHELRDSSGNVLTNAAYQPSVLCDPGRAAYQTAWANKIISRIRNYHGAEGVFIDDLVQSSHIANAIPSIYPTRALWRAAVEEFVSVVVPLLRAAGLKVMLNTGAWYPGITTFDDGTASIDWATTLGTIGGASGVSCMIENGYQTVDNVPGTLRLMGPGWTQHWDGWSQVITAIEAAGLDYVGLADAPAGDSSVAIYIKASTLLWANRPGSSVMFRCDDIAATPFGTKIKTDMGAPLGVATLSGQEWSRNFVNGSVQVNPWVGTASITLA